ncbi:MAG TPA: hypothetical protein VGT61_01220 [Thermomicrobiales bacterium]|jgi:hypothetical protein|nr:hypothetical protein [Thermomicrobiales bacterium]
MSDADARTTQLPVRPTRESVSRRTRLLLRILFIVFVVMLAVLAVRLVQGELAWWQMGIGLAAGAVVGIALGRMNRVRWDQATGSVVSQMDMVGVSLLLVYLAFTFSRSRIAAAWVDDAHAAAGVALALGAGSIAGRVLYLLRGISNALEVAGLRPGRRP